MAVVRTRAKWRRGAEVAVEGRGSRGSSSSYKRVERREERRLTREVAMESSRIWSIGSLVVWVRATVARWWQGRRDQWARQIGQVMLPWRTLEAMQVRWKVWVHSAVKMEDGPSAVVEAGLVVVVVVAELRGSRQIAHRLCVRENTRMKHASVN